MKANIHILATSLTNQRFTLGVASAVYMGINKNLQFSRFAGKVSGVIVAGPGIYGVVQGAADSARRLQLSSSVYYSALYMRELEMMYFLVESVFVKAGALKMQQISDDDIADVIIRMSR